MHAGSEMEVVTGVIAQMCDCQTRAVICDVTGVVRIGWYCGSHSRFTPSCCTADE